MSLTYEIRNEAEKKSKGRAFHIPGWESSILRRETCREDGKSLALGNFVYLKKGWGGGGGGRGIAE